MKKTVFIGAALALYSCQAEKELQVEFINAELIRVDTVTRYPTSQQMLVWKCSNNIEYVSYVPINSFYPVGKKMMVMVQK